MSLATDLLEQARHLATREKGRPKQGSLRRAVSTAYYALFHFLLEAAARHFVTDSKLRFLVSRAFSHGDMQNAARCFASGGSLPAHIAAAFSGTVPAELRRIAKAFVELQQARHQGDYDRLHSFNRPDTLMFVTQAEQAFRDWQAVKPMFRTTHDAPVVNCISRLKK
jgi:hypothetical protein